MAVKRIVALMTLVAALLLLAPGALAVRTYVDWLDGDVRLYAPREQDWTYVTQENFEAQMELVISHGFDAEDARRRFASGETVFEAYHKSALKDGCLRLQVFETPFTRKVWDHTSMSGEERQALLDDLEADKSDLPFDFRNPKYKTWNGGGKNNYIDSGYVSLPPRGYESGRMNLQFRNGKAYVLSYVMHHRVSTWDWVKDAEEKAVRDRLNDMNLKMERLSEGVEMTLDGADLLRVTREGLAISGKAEEGAEISVACEGAWTNCSMQEDGRFIAEAVFEHDGEYRMEIKASRDGKGDTTIPVRVLATRNMCPLQMEQAPAAREEAGEKTIRGRTLPGAEVYIRVEQEAYTLYADDDGAFEQTIDMSQYGVYAIEISAFYEGLETAKLSYDTQVIGDVQKMIKQVRSRVTSVPLSKLIKNPDNHIGKMVSFEARVDEITYVPGGMHIRVATKDENGDRQRYMLSTTGYAEDQIYKEMRLTFYGEVTGMGEFVKEDGETLTLPCIHIDCVPQWLVIIK